jgi:hypothetical protein
MIRCLWKRRQSAATREAMVGIGDEFVASVRRQPDLSGGFMNNSQAHPVRKMVARQAAL